MVFKSEGGGRVFEQVLKMDDVREANIKYVVGINVVVNRRVPVLGELNERGISIV